GERDRLVVDDGAAEHHAVLRVRQRVLVRGAGDADRLGTDRRAAQLERAHRGLAPAGPPGPGTVQARVELVLAAQQAASRHPDVVEEDVGGVRRAQAQLLDLATALQALRTRRDDERRLAAGAERRVDGGDD